MKDDFITRVSVRDGLVAGYENAPLERMSSALALLQRFSGSRQGQLQFATFSKVRVVERVGEPFKSLYLLMCGCRAFNNLGSCFKLSQLVASRRFDKSFLCMHSRS